MRMRLSYNVCFVLQYRWSAVLKKEAEDDEPTGRTAVLTLD